MKILLGISGGIAAYKCPELIRLMTKRGFDVIPVLTAHATQFVTQTSLQAVSRSDVYVDNGTSGASITHLDLARHAHIMLIAPATANSIAKCAHGMADDVLTTTFLSFTGPKLIVPAMHTEMYTNTLTQENLATLKRHGVYILGPDEGDLACQDSGVGRMVELELIVLHCQLLGLAPLSLKGKKLLISCGGTREKIDSVRVLTNHSSGALGMMMAHLASFMGAEVKVVSTVPILSNPHIEKIYAVETVSEMKAALEAEIAWCDALYMAAAVSDFTVEESPMKYRRKDHFELQLHGTEDILLSLTAHKKEQTFIGFCLADDALEKTALEKLEKKNLDFIVANRPHNIGQPRRDVTVFSRGSKTPVLSLTQSPVLETAYELLKLIA